MPEQAKAFAEIVVESRWPANAMALNRLSWISGPVIVAPYVASVRGVGRLNLATMTADRTEVRLSQDAPDLIEGVLFQREDGAFVELDAQAWRYWSAKGEPLGEPVPHGLDYCPAVVFRCRQENPLDFWGATDHQTLVDATIEVSWRQALGLCARQNALAPQVIIVGELEGIPQMQALGHFSQPLYINRTPNEVRVEVHERRVNVQDILAEIGSIAADAVSRYGIPLAETRGFTTNNSEWGSLASVVRAHALGAQRDRQAPLLKESEKALWSVTCDVCRVSIHPLADAMLAPADLHSTLRLGLPDTADVKERTERLRYLKEALPLGLETPLEYIMQQRNELTAEEAAEELQANLQNYIDVIKPLVERNVPANPDGAFAVDQSRGLQSQSQIQGREGGQISGETRRADSQQ